jgi:hypothetical protein
LGVKVSIFHDSKIIFVPFKSHGSLKPHLFKYQNHDGIPFSGSSNLLHALYQSLDTLNLEKRLQNIQFTFDKIVEKLKKSPFTVVQPSGDSAVMVNIKIPTLVSSETMGRSLEHKGYLLHYRSAYLISKNRLQIALMTESAFAHYLEMVDAIERSYAEQKALSK